MLVLRSSPASPFGRKVKIAATVLGLKDKIKVENANTTDPGDKLRQQNPLGKIPALILEDGTTLFDSRVIVEYLDFIAGGGKILPVGEARFPVLRAQALADGLMDAALLLVYERRFRPKELHFPDWQAYQTEKIERVLTSWEAALPAPVTSMDGLDVGIITTACALGYLDLRLAGEWRNRYPGLAAWVDGFEQAVPVFAETKLSPQPVGAVPEPLR